MSPIPTRPGADARPPRRRRIALLLVAFAVLAVAWTSPVLLMSPDAEGRALIAAGVPRADFAALIAEGGTAYAADTLAHDWADTCDRQADAESGEDSWAQQGLSALQRFNPFRSGVDCDRVRAIALRTESLRDDADDETCTDDEDGDGAPDAPSAVAAGHRQRVSGGHRRRVHDRKV